jgi:hypothetical protein
MREDSTITSVHLPTAWVDEEKQQVASSNTFLELKDEKATSGLKHKENSPADWITNASHYWFKSCKRMKQFNSPVYFNFLVATVALHVTAHLREED